MLLVKSEKNTCKKNKVQDQTVWICRLIQVCTICIWHKVPLQNIAQNSYMGVIVRCTCILMKKKILAFVQQNLIIFFSIKNINIFNLQQTLGKFRRCKLMTSFLFLFEKRVWHFMHCLIRRLFAWYRIYHMYSDRQACANSIDPDETPQNAASHLGLHCLPLIQQFLDTTSGSELYWFKF